MNIFSQIFGSAAPVQQPTQATPGNIPPTAKGADTQNPTVPAGTVESSKQESSSPLDKYTDLWKTAPNAVNDNKVTFDADPQKIMEAASKVDFSKVVKPETLQKIQAGGENAAAAFLEAMNAVSQASFAQSAMATSKIVESALAKQSEQFDQHINRNIKKQSVSTAVRDTNPSYNHPAISPIMDALENSMTASNPNASPQEIKEKISDFLSVLSGINAPPAKDADSSKKSTKEMDWSDFIN